MSKRNRSKSGAQAVCPDCARKLRGEKGLIAHMAAEHGKAPIRTDPDSPITGWQVKEARS